MGREIRKVPPNWEHPQDQPMYNKTFAQAAKQWKDEFAAWERGERPSYCDDEKSRGLEFWEWDGGPPEHREYYRPWSDEEATWFQLWETVSEGTPVSPPFATMEELVTYLAEHGDEGIGWGHERAEAFCADGWAPTIVMIDGQLLEGTELALHLKQKGK